MLSCLLPFHFVLLRELFLFAVASVPLISYGTIFPVYVAVMVNWSLYKWLNVYIDIFIYVYVCLCLYTVKLLKSSIINSIPLWIIHRHGRSQIIPLWLFRYDCFSSHPIFVFDFYFFLAISRLAIFYGYLDHAFFWTTRTREKCQTEFLHMQKSTVIFFKNADLESRLLRIKYISLVYWSHSEISHCAIKNVKLENASRKWRWKIFMIFIGTKQLRLNCN